MPTNNLICSPSLLAALPHSQARQHSGHSFYVTPPADGKVRVRRLVHRGAPRPVYKFWSLKLNRIVQCESALEVKVGQLLDASPEAILFGEQPAILHYADSGQWRVHVPDFAVHGKVRREFIEVKYGATIDKMTEHRTSTLGRLLAQFGWGYRLVTEAHVHQGCWLSNAQALLQRGREKGAGPWSLHVYDQVRRQGQISLGDFGWSEQGSQEAVWIASELVRGHLHVDRCVPITAQTPVLLPDNANFGRTLPW